MVHVNADNQLVIVTAKQMRLIEQHIFQGGMPVASLMEKAALLTSQWIQALYPQSQFSQVGIVVGCGHNGGDSLVIARELHLQGYSVYIYAPLAEKAKELTAQHCQYAQEIGINLVTEIEELNHCDLIIDGLFGFGLTRTITGKLAEMIEQINQWQKPVVSVDIPSGIHTDTGAVLGIAIKASHTLCLGLWKQGLFQEQALEYVGEVERIDFGIPPHIIKQVLGEYHPLQLISPITVKKSLPLPRQLNTHKYKQGHLLLICGSQKYVGAALLSAYGAISSGVGMLSVAVPVSLKKIINAQIPSALVIPCQENGYGAIACLPELDLNKYQAIACGMGITTKASVLPDLLKSNIPLILDADALNILADHQDLQELIKQRQASTILTPHQGEFNRLFPDLSQKNQLDRIEISQKAAKTMNSLILLKGARTIITNPQSQTRIVANSTPALARGGSGDVLSGFLGGLVAQSNLIAQPLVNLIASGAWLHQQAGILAVENYTEMGVEGVILAKYLTQAIRKLTVI
jgi:NAD(P)H-hydrate epimerase